MATNATIAIEMGTNVRAVQVHFDGYYEGVGRILYDHYDRTKAANLIALGDVSIVAKNIGEQHNSDLPYGSTEYNELKAKKWCVFYTRDRGEDAALTAFRHFNSRDEYIEKFGVGYDYLIDKDGVWWTYVYSRDFEGWARLEDVLNKSILVD